MKQILTDLYKVEFNTVRMLSSTGPHVVVHESNPEDYIVLNPMDMSVVVGEPYLLPLQRYGGGFKKKTLLAKNCCWVGSGVASKLANNRGSVRTHSYRMVETDV